MISLLRRNRDFRMLYIAQVISYAGDWFATVALAGLVLDRTGSDFAQTLVWVAAALPAFLVTPWAGPTADRFDRRRIMLACSAAQAALTGFYFLGQHSWIGFGIGGQALVAGVAAFFTPASGAALANLVDPEDLPTAANMASATWGAMLAIGSALGALVAQHFGRTTAFAGDTASFVIAGLLILRVKRATRRADAPKPPGTRIRPIRDTVETLKFARNNEIIRSLLLSKAGFGFGTGVVGLLAVLAKRRFGTGDDGIGLLLVARGAGVLLGPALLKRSIAKGLPRVLTACGYGAIAYGVFYGLVPVPSAIGIAAIFVFFAHAGGGVQWGGCYYGLQQASPDELRGRIISADYALVTVTMSVSLVAAGLLSNRYGPRPVMFGLAAVEVAWGCAFLAMTRRVRRSVPPTPPVPPVPASMSAVA